MVLRSGLATVHDADYQRAFRQLAAGANRRGQAVGGLVIRVEVLGGGSPGEQTLALTEIGARLQCIVRCEDNLGMGSPDEFVLTTATDGDAGLAAMARRIQAEIDHQPLTVAGVGEIRARALIGGAAAADGRLRDLLACAREALDTAHSGITISGAAPVEPPVTPNWRPASATGRASRLLLALASPEERAAIRAHIDASGMRILEASTAADADALRRMEPVDVSLVDANLLAGARNGMPHDDADATAPVIVLAGDRVDAVALLDAGAHDVVRRPFDPAEIGARAAAALRVKAKLDALAWRAADVEAFALQSAHDLKSPLTTIGGMAAALRTMPGRNGDLADGDLLLDRIAAASGRAATMIDDFLALAGFGAHVPATVTPEPQQVVRSTVAALAIADASIRVSGTWAPVAAARAEIAGLVTNLVTNADRYGRDSDGRLILRISGRTDKGFQHITVADGGSGFPAAASDPFEPRAGGDPQAGASHLGLSLIRQTLLRRGGTATISDAGPGAAVTISLPRYGGGEVPIVR